MVNIKVNGKEITERHKLTIAKGLCDYSYIMNNKGSIDEDFKQVYYDFYLKARWSKMTKENQAGYFGILKNLPDNADLISIVSDLQKKIGSYEFSLCTKLLHTKNPNNPIYDSKVHNYLKTQKVSFSWRNRGKKDITEIINEDWEKLNTWYDDFRLNDGKEWIAWFNEEFPNYSDISDVKKIDFIIFATN